MFTLSEALGIWTLQQHPVSCPQSPSWQKLWVMQLWSQTASESLQHQAEIARGKVLDIVTPHVICQVTSPLLGPSAIWCQAMHSSPNIKTRTLHTSLRANPSPSVTNLFCQLPLPLLYYRPKPTTLDKLLPHQHKICLGHEQIPSLEYDFPKVQSSGGCVAYWPRFQSIFLLEIHRRYPNSTNGHCPPIQLQDLRSPKMSHIPFPGKATQASLSWFTWWPLALL